MSACQISFASFAASLLASVQDEPTDCTPPVQETAPAVVAHPVAVDGGECIQPSADYAEFTRLTALAESTAVFPLADPISRGGYVLMALANCYGPVYPGRQSQASLIETLRFHAASAIGAGC